MQFKHQEVCEGLHQSSHEFERIVYFVHMLVIFPKSCVVVHRQRIIYHVAIVQVPTYRTRIKKNKNQLLPLLLPVANSSHKRLVKSQFVRDD
eukprot:758760-Hanusia_phi.AAC.3